jgi:putative transposase
MSALLSGRYRAGMARLPRFFLPDTPQHVIQRGNDRQAIFDTLADRVFYKECLTFAARRHGVAVHAYVLMTNHVHLLVTPGAATSLPCTMQSVGRVYVRYFNAQRGRSGTLWEGRYKAAIVDCDGYFLACMRYIEQNPVRAGLVERPGQYPWSSHGANAIGTSDPLVSAHGLYRKLGTSPAARRSAYRALFDGPVAEAEVAAIRDATQNAWALGDAEFRRNVEQLSRRAERARMGRPTKVGSGAEKVESDPTSGVRGGSSPRRRDGPRRR